MQEALEVLNLVTAPSAGSFPLPEHVAKVSRVFRAFELVAPNDVRVVIVGQDPYPDATNATGLAFSVPRQDNNGKPIKPPASLQRILARLRCERGYRQKSHGDLTSWAKNGLLLLNRILTVGEVPLSHADCHWQEFTDAVVVALASNANGQERPIDIFLLGDVANELAPKLVRAPFVVVHQYSHPVASRCTQPIKLFSRKDGRPFETVHPFWDDGET